MSDTMFKIDTDFSGARSYSAAVQKYILGYTKQLVSKSSLYLQRHIRYDLFGSYPDGTTDSTLSTRSGKLKKSVSVLPTTVSGDVVSGGIGIGTRYARVHFGKRGQVTTISSKSGKMLAIPLPAALGPGGVAKGGPREMSMFGSTFIAKRKAGYLIIFGKLKYVKGKSAGKEKGDIVPLFVLKKSVNVKARIIDEDLVKYTRVYLDKGMNDLKEGLKNVGN